MGLQISVLHLTLILMSAAVCYSSSTYVTGEGKKVCVDVNNEGTQTLTFYSDVWTYVQMIQYTIE